MIDRRGVLTNLVVGSALAASSGSAFAAGDGPVAETRAGKVRGAMDNGVYVFKGVPYGADTATTRFQPPKPPLPWTGVRDCLADGPMAPQVSKTNDYAKMSEDCLSLNLWTPGLKDGKKRPVMLWLHGSGTTGGSNRGTYGANLARKGDVVVVVINHRVGVHGFLYIPEAGPQYADSGNAGMLDIIHSLKWVKENADSFGGDAGNVTVFGCSGGGAKLSMLMGMTPAKGLFHKAIIESGASDLRTKDKKEGLEAAQSYLTLMKLTPKTAGELNKLTMAQVINGLHRSKEEPNDDMGVQRYFSPVIDGRTLPRDSFVPDASPVSANVPLLVGCGKWEYTTLLGKANPHLFELSWDEVPGELKKTWTEFHLPHDPNYVVAQYRRMFPTLSPSDTFFLAVTDSKFWIGALTQAGRKAAQNAAPVYNYVMDWTTPVQGGRLKAPHGIEVPLVFDSVKETPGETGGGADAQHMADQLSAAWAAFAHTGKPDAATIPHWPAYDLKTRATMYFNTESKVVMDPDREKRLMWEKLEEAVHA